MSQTTLSTIEQREWEGHGKQINVGVLPRIQFRHKLTIVDPGCAVDIPGALYSLSWFPNPQFNKVYPSQFEILTYIHRVATTYGVDKHVRLGTVWTGASWNELDSLWHVNLMDQSGTRYTHKARILVSAVGAYSNPKATKIPNAEIFEGKIAHTTQWDRSYDLRGQNVVVVGNGCECESTTVLRSTSNLST